MRPLALSPGVGPVSLGTGLGQALLAQRGVGAIEEIRVDLDPTQREAMVALTGRRTVPQIFIGDAHVGGCDDLYALDQSGTLDPMLAG